MNIIEAFAAANVIPDTGKRVADGEMTISEAAEVVRAEDAKIGLNTDDIGFALLERVDYFQSQGMDMMSAMAFASVQMDAFRAGTIYVRSNAEALRQLVEGDGETPSE